MNKNDAVFYAIIAIAIAVLYVAWNIDESGATALESPISPLPSPTPIVLDPPKVCEMTLACEGIPSETQTCTGRVRQDVGRLVVVELHTAFKTPFVARSVYSQSDEYEWRFEVSFARVPCYLGRPYARFFLKAVDLVIPPPYYDYVCQEIFLIHNGCTALPFVGSWSNER